MVDIAIKVLSVIAGIICGVAAYPYLNEFVFALLAVIGAVAVGVIAGYLAYLLLTWVLGAVNRQV